MRRRPLDLELVRRGLAETRRQAREAIVDGRVTVDGRPSLSPQGLIRPDEPVSVDPPDRRYASRGGDKLAAALARFDVDPSRKLCLDAGASTVGFTDVLLGRGAAHVVSVDVGYGQLAWRLRQDARVTVMERFNVRDLRTEDLPYSPQVVVADLSFISLEKVVPALAKTAAAGADLVLLVKPQFEAGRDEIGSGGVVADPAVWRRVLESVTGCCRWSGLSPMDVMASPVPGPAGNVEFLLHARKGGTAQALDLDAAVEEGIRL